MHASERNGNRRHISPETWLRVIQDEYLSEYMRAGGSAVKVISGSDELLRGTRNRLRDMAEDGNYLCAELDPAKPEPGGKRPDLHRIDKFFFAATVGVDWKAAAAQQARRYLARRGVMVREGRTLSDLDGIAADNGRLPEDLLNQYQMEFATPQMRDIGMAFEFRAAVTALGRAQLIPDAVTPTVEEVVLSWLAGHNLPGAASALKKIQILERISQSNARHMLASFTRWLPQTGHDGLVIVLDFRPYEHKKLTKPQREREQMRKIKEAIARGASTEEMAAIVAEADNEPAVSYTDAAYLQMLTLIRHFIDEIDWFERMLLVVLTSPRFYDSSSRRHYFDYDALQTRIGQEVHDARRANPAAALVHLGDAL